MVSTEEFLNPFDSARTKVNAHPAEEKDLRNWNSQLNKRHERMEDRMLKKKQTFSVNEVWKMEVKTDDFGTEEPFIQIGMAARRARGLRVDCAFFAVGCS